MRQDPLKQALDIVVLLRKEKLTVDEIAERLSICRRSVLRYLKTLKEYFPLKFEWEAHDRPKRWHIL